MRKALILIFVSLLWWSCEQSKEEPVTPLFQLLDSESTGVAFSNDLTETPDFNILEYLYFYNGAGVATADFDNDGLIDLYFVANQQPNKLYLNKGALRFEDITESAGVAGKGTWSTGVTIADVNGDGFTDIYVSQVGDYKEARGGNQLFINNGDLTFTESAAEYGLNFVGFSTQAAFFDYDRDGDLDMYLLNHSVKNPAVFSRSSARTEKDELGGDRLYESQLAQGSQRFKDVTEAAGIYSSSLGFGLGLAISDINNDGWPDIYVSNDFTENDYLYLNNQNGTFSESLEQQIAYTSRYSMGNVADDLDNDGLNEIVTTDMLPSDPEIWQMSVGEDKAEIYDIKKNFGYAHQYVRNTLQKNLGNGTFSDVSLMAGTYATDWSWAPLTFDMDNDGLLDLHISNGIYKRPNDLDYVNYGQDQEGVKSKSPDELEAFQIANLPTVKIPNYAGRNKGNLTFEPVADAWGLGQASYSNGSAYADLDNDGDLDLVVNNTHQKAFLYENKADKLKSNHYLKLRLKGPALNLAGLGAKVTLSTKTTKMTRELIPTRGFQSAVSQELVFGLGAESEVEILKVYWPNGAIEEIAHPAIDTSMVITYSASTLLETIDEEPSPVTVTEFDGYTHIENTNYKDYNHEYLIPRKYSTEGPALATADVNADGLTDMYLGGAKGEAGSLWLQQPDGSFQETENPSFEMLARAEDTDALFFDANGDNMPDLYVVSAGNEYSEGQVFIFDRLYLNDGRGNLQFVPTALPQFGTHGRTVAAADIDGDGDQDLFVGANLVHGTYGLNPDHYLLINDGRGHFTNGTAERIPFVKDLGMLNKALWWDYDNDNDPDLLLAGEWTSLMILENDGQGVFNKADVTGLEGTEGWWFSLALADLDGDGDQDIIAGNMGLNSKLKASADKPVTLYVNDFDRNGQTDPVIFHYMQDAQIPFSSRDDLVRQMSFIKKKHPNYSSYARLRKPSDLFSSDQLFASVQKKVKTFASTIFINEGNAGFRSVELPLAAQLSPVMDIHVSDLDQDGNMDLLLAGNFYGFRTDIGRAGAKPLTWLLGKGDGTFTHQAETSLNTQTSWGEYRHLAEIKPGLLIGVRNGDRPVIIRFEY